MPKAYSYTRFSTLTQAGGDSLRRQTAAAKAWCEDHDAVLVEDFRDLGVSAFKGKNVKGGALGAFLKIAESGKVPPGSFLIVESLDRITRAEITVAVSLFLRIIASGVTVVTLADRQIYDNVSVNADPAKIIISITILMRAHEESATKSRRGRAAWGEKLKRARKGEIKLTSRGPHWLKLVNNDWKLIKKRVTVVRRVFDDICAGKTLTRIVRALNDEKVPTFRGGKHWCIRTVTAIVDQRTTLGEYQPHKLNDAGDKREPVGAPIENYYPVIVTPAQWAQVQIVRKTHKSNRGGGRTPVKNAFRGVIFAADGERLHCQYCKGRNGSGYTYLRENTTRTLGKKTKSWNYGEFKTIFCHLFSKVLERAPTHRDNSAADKIKFEIGAVKAKEANLAKSLANGYSEAVDELLRKIGEERIALEERLIGAEATPVAPHVSMIDWRDEEELGANVRATVRRITVDANARCFEVETLTGGLLSYREKGNKAIFKFDENTVLEFPEAVKDLRASRGQSLFDDFMLWPDTWEKGAG